MTFSGGTGGLMAGRWRDPSAFRADPAAASAARPSYRQTLALLAALVLVAGAVAIASYVVRPDRARAFQLFHGSLFLADEQSPVAIDLPSGRPTLRLVGADKQVGVTGTDGLGVVPLDGGTLLLNQRTGEFNMVDNSGFVVKHDGGGVPLGQGAGSQSAMGVADGELAYVIRNRTAGADVFLVSQATVTAALSATGAVTPRAGTTLPGASVDTTAAGTAVAADGALWALVGTGGTSRSIRQFTYPADSNPGVRLTSQSHGAVSGPAAIGTATTGDGTAVGVATPGRIEIFGPVRRTVDFLAPAGADRVLPASDADTRLSYLISGSGGWSLVSVAADGSDLRAPRIVAGLPAGDELTQPAYSRGALYTLDRTSGAIYRVSLTGAAKKVAAYPFVSKIETTDLSDAYVIARGARVVVNSGKHSRALVLFTDGSQLPRVIEKSSAVQVSAAGGAEQLARTTVNAGPQPGQSPSTGAGKPRPAPAQVVNPHLDCKDVTQTPHVPSIGAIQPGSRSVTLSWVYPIIDKTQDCFPTTYLVEIKLLSPDAPKAPGAAQIQGQQGATITGLFPQSRYEVRVTAYINKQGTASGWVPFQTGP
ncbi:MAG TPA: fibronectin type III domain-containing protein, partial [Jatrophihabitans sp.]|nr:fibronectin type III domain-containing protein [Jatrophihabitans sp.]